MPRTTAEVPIVAQPTRRWRFLLPPLASWSARLLKALRVGSESQIVINRIIIGFSVLAYIVLARTLWGTSIAEGVLLTSGSYALIGILFLCDLLIRARPSRLRVALQLLADTGALSIGMHIGGQVTSVLYPIYLWAVLGYGLRFGLLWLRAATACAFIGFAICIATTPYWRHDLFITFGLLAGLVAIPLYVGSLIRSLSEAKQQAEEANQAKSRFLARVSHELRTPLNAVIGMTDLLAGTHLNTDQKDMVRTTGTAGRSLLSLIDGILDFARIEAGKMPIQNAELELAPLIHTIERLVAAPAQLKGLTVSSYIAARTPALLWGDSRHLTEILLNLAGNAVKFTQHGHVLISVDVEARAEDVVMLLIEVSDTGIGIASEAQTRIFDSFTQADNTIIDSFGGTGLGLSISRNLAEMHGGRITVTSKIGEGSTFCVAIPLRLAHQSPPSLPPLKLGLISGDSRLIGALVARLEDRGLEVFQHIIPRDIGPDLLGSALTEFDGLKGLFIDGSSLTCARSYLREAAETAGRPPIILLESEELVEAPDIPLRRGCLSLLKRDPPDHGLDNVLRAIAAWSTAEAAGPLIGRTSGMPLHVLVADDNRVNQNVVAKILDRGGHSYRIVANGEEALDALEEQRFDLVLMDVNMPIMDGIEATQLHRFGAVHDKRLPIFAMTADATPELAQRCINAGMDLCIVKPVGPGVLLDILDGFVAADGKAKATRLATSESRRHESGARGGAKTPLNPGTLKDLEMLGGPEFLAQISQQFMSDALGLLSALRAAAEVGETATFQAEAHALSGLAANIGADAVLALCAKLRKLDLREPASYQVELLSLKIELERVQQTLHRHINEGASLPAFTTFARPRARAPWRPDAEP